MAGGKETPRQKMIGMMYLVLTALLALQVGSAVLDKFAIINTTMEKTNGENIGKNNETLKTIAEAAGKSDNKTVNAAKDAAVKLRALTDKTYNNIETLKQQLIVESGGTKVDEKLIQNHGSAAASLMINKPQGKDYEKWLKDYVNELNAIMAGVSPKAKKYEDIAKAPKDIELFKDNEDHANKDFITFTFENTPVIAGLASVTESQAQILDYEKDALAELAAIADAVNIKLDKFILMARPKSSVVAAGSKYEADLFITGSSSALNPTFTKDGAPIPISDEGGIKMGKISINAVGGGYDKDGNVKRTFKAMAKLGDKDIPGEITYTVARPVVEVTTGAAPTLYMNCGNPVNFKVAALGASYNPSFAGGGGVTIERGSQAGQTMIIPNQRKVKVTVSNAGSALDTKEFNVLDVPRPRFVAKTSNGGDIDKKTGLPTSTTGFRIAIEADPNFKSLVPADANYRIKELNVVLLRGRNAVNQFKLTSGTIDLTPFKSQWKTGDRVLIEFKDVTRTTYKGGADPVRLSSNDNIEVSIN